MSNDGSVDMVKSDFADVVKIFVNTENKLSAGQNLGFKNSKGDYIVHVGTDCFPTSKALLELMSFIKSYPDTGIATGKIVMRDGTLDWDAHRGIPRPWTSLSHFLQLDKLLPKNKFFSAYFMSYENLTAPHEIGTCISHFMFIPRTAYEKVGLWDTNYMLYGEDIDFCYRMKKAGYKVMYVPSAEILHYKGAGVGRKTTRDLQNASRRDVKHLKKIRAETTRAMRLFYTDHLAKEYPWLVNTLVYSGIYVLQSLRNVSYSIKNLIS